jgi:hypothetical protein
LGITRAAGRALRRRSLDEWLATPSSVGHIKSRKREGMEDMESMEKTNSN